MRYAVRFQPAAVEDLDDAYQRAAKNAPVAATRWLERFHTALQTLDHNPQRCPLAWENDKSELTLRQYLFGKRPNVFRVIYTIQDETVWVLRIRRAQRRPLKRGDIGEPDRG